jgi:hypothetical protein
VEGLSLDLDSSQKETRNSSSELFRIKNAYEESVLQLEEVKNLKKLFLVSFLKLYKIKSVCQVSQINLKQAGFVRHFGFIQNKKSRKKLCPGNNSFF